MTNNQRNWLQIEEKKIFMKISFNAEDLVDIVFKNGS